MNKLSIAVVFLLAGSIGEARANESPVPALHYRADAGVETNTDGKVIAWRNLGSLGSAGDLTKIVEKGGGPAESQIVLDETGANGRPSVKFNGTSALRTDGSINLNTSAGGTWIVTYKADDADNHNRGILGASPTSGADRHGAFFDYEGVLWPWFAGIRTGFINSHDDWTLLSFSAWDDSGRKGCIYYGGEYVCIDAGSDNYEAHFYVGILGALDFMDPLKGEITEVRYYMTPLSASERMLVQFEMERFAGVKPSETIVKGRELFDADDNAYSYDLVGFGLNPGGAIGPEGQEGSGFSGGLTMFLSRGTCYLAHNNEEGDDRVWAVAMDGKELGEDINVRISLELDAESSCKFFGEKVRLLYRSSTTNEWQILSRMSKRDNDKGLIRSSLDTWRNGYYRFVNDTVDANLVLHYRADTGVETNAEGKVVAWRNLGNLGNVGDLVKVVDKGNVECTSDITIDATGAGGRPSIQFGGASCLMTDGGVKICLNDAADFGTCWFVAFKSGFEFTAENRGLFGTVDVSDEANRFGAFQPLAFPGTFNVNDYQRGAANSINIPAGWGVLSHSAWSAGSMPFNGTYGSFDSNLPANAFFEAQPFFVGKLGTLTWMEPFIGEIAEIRCYSKTLSAAERSAVQLDMGIASGVTVMTDFGDLALFAADGKAYTRDFAGFGFRPNIAGSTIDAAKSGGLILDYVETPSGTANTLACVAHNALEGSSRVWCLMADASTSAEGHNHAIKFTYEAAKASKNYQLYYRASTTEKWVELGTLERESPADAPSIVLPAGWQDGYYCIKSPMLGFTILVY